MWQAVITGLFTLVSGVALLWVTAGGWGKLGHRVERLSQVAKAVPEGPSRDRLNQAIEAEAARLADSVLNAPPRWLKFSVYSVFLVLYYGLFFGAVMV
jgi:hypothetical protein